MIEPRKWLLMERCQNSKIRFTYAQDNLTKADLLYNISYLIVVGNHGSKLRFILFYQLAIKTD